MTDKEQHAQLLADCVQKASAYLEAVRIHGQFDAFAKGSRLQWEQAEAALATGLALNENDVRAQSTGHMADVLID